MSAIRRSIATEQPESRVTLFRDGVSRRGTTARGALFHVLRAHVTARRAAPLLVLALAVVLATVAGGCATGTIVEWDCDPGCAKGEQCVEGQCVDDACPSGDCAEPECGNGVLEEGEFCDGADVGVATCVSKGFQGGPLLCGTACLFDVTQCCNDCGGSTCGDGACDGNESAASCCVDCGCAGGGQCQGAAPGSCVLVGWDCNPQSYDAGDGCHCGCGIPDPDCNNPGAQVLNCGPGESCSSAGECVPNGWFCNPADYDSGDGCHCGCGLWDPDCNNDPQPAINCSFDEQCSFDGECVGDVTPGWFCDLELYGTNDGCDCECGAWDPDCDNPDEQVFNCSGSQICVQPGVCSGDGNPDGWFCDPFYYGTSDGCDCECGAWDPDCDDPGQPILGCAGNDICVQPGVCAPDGGDVWMCAPELYAAGNGCDCMCGIYDPDCDDPAQAIFNCAVDEACVEPGVCSSGGLPPGWVCPPEYYGTSDGCDCLCGALDLDCNNPNQPVLGCQGNQTCIDPGICSP